MIETMPLARAEAYDRMKRGDARFRMAVMAGFEATCNRNGHTAQKYAVTVGSRIVNDAFASEKSD
jgi:hypothetical protein